MNKFPFRRSRHRLVRPVWLALVAACASAAVMAGESALGQNPPPPAVECTGLWTRCVDVCPPYDDIVAECNLHSGPNCEYDGLPGPCHNVRFWACGHWFNGQNQIRCGYQAIPS